MSVELVIEVSTVKRFLTIIALVMSANLAQLQVAHAFQETDVPVTEVPVTSSDVASHSAGMKTPLSSLDVNDETDSKKGTVLHIPGFGVVGTLPKLDFGLELLYSDDETKIPELQSEDDISIKGRFKHNF